MRFPNSSSIRSLQSNFLLYPTIIIIIIILPCFFEPTFSEPPSPVSHISLLFSQIPNYMNEISQWNSVMSKSLMSGRFFILTFQSKLFNLSSWFKRLRLAHYFSLVQSAEGDFFMFSVPKASKRALGPVNRTRNEKWRTLRKSYKWLCFGHIAVLGQFCFTVGYLVVFFVATCSHRLPFILLGVLTHTRNVQFKRDIEKTSQISSESTDQNKCFWFLLA